VETIKERIGHLDKIRDLQDRTGGFDAFIPWPMQLKNTSLEIFSSAGSVEFLKTIAISRIYLDNIPNIQSSWLTMGRKLAQLALRFGANDLDGTLYCESVVSATGITRKIESQDLERLIIGAGFLPKRRDPYYRIL
jgi:cyclic dehypoxanthinyl futalosine synthase